MKKFSISLKRIPHDIEIIINPFPFFQAHKSLIITMMTMLTIFILILMFYLRKISKMKQELLLKNNELSELYEKLAFADEALKQQCNKLGKAQLELLNNVNELEELTYTVSPDLKAPLRAVDGCDKVIFEDCGEKLEIFFPKTDVNRIIELIEKGDLRANNVAEHIVQIIGTNLNNDIIKMESVLKSAILEITKAVFKRHKWLDKFLNITQLEFVDFSGCETIEALGKEFCLVINEITSAINTLYLSNSGSEIVYQVCNHVLENVDSEISLGIISNKLFMNKTYISESFKQKTGVGFVEYLKIVKMERAKRLICEGNLKIYEIGEKLGYKDVEYFSRQFKKNIGLTPIKYRQINIKKDKKLQYPKNF